MEGPPARDSTPAPTPAFLTPGVLLLAAALRPVATSVGPLTHQIRAGLHLSGATAGLLLTIPVLCFGVAAPLAPVLARRWGIAPTVTLLLAAITAGLALRVTGGFAVLLLGTTLAAAGAASGNVLLPVIVRRNFADRIGRISALYTTSLVGVASLSAGLTVPLASAIGRGWRGGLAAWALLGLVALLVWLPQLRGVRGAARPSAPHVRIRDITRDRLTWELTGFFAVQSWGFYTIVAWMPSIFESHGISSTDAGLLLGLSSAMAIPAALLVPRVAARLRDQRALAFWLTVPLVFGYGGLLLAPAAAPVLWAVLTGLAQGSCFPLALTLIVLRSGSPSVASSLSTHVQSVGYLLAASGPLIGGALHDATGSWTATIVVLIVALVPQALTGLGCGRARVVGAPSQ